MMIRCRCLTTFFLLVIVDAFIDDSSIPREIFHVNVGQRIRIDCQLNNSMIGEHRKGLWLRLEDAEVFFYGTSRISPDLRYQIEERTRLQIFNQSFAIEIVTYSLIIDDLKLTDEGTYSCQADNRIIKLFLLNLVERPYFLLDQSIRLYRRQSGEFLSIHCHAEGKPKPSISWRKKVNESHQIVVFNCSMTSSNCPLIFSDVQQNHQGVYECLATNPHGTIGRFYELDVQFRPSVKMFSSINDELHFDCFIDGNPRPDIRWLIRFDNEQQIDLTDEKRQTNLSRNLRLIKPEQLNSTRWKTSLFIERHIRSSLFNSIILCQAENSLGDDQNSYRILPNFSSPRPENRSTRIRFSSLIFILIFILD